MTTPQWDRVKELFLQALELPPTDRERFLESFAGDDASLRDEVQSLLASHTDDDFLETPPAGPDPTPAATASTTAGNTVGPFRLVREIGRGGMGTVWEAHRTGDDFEQRVAVKIIASHLSAAAFEERFIAERQILASLEHPNIARLLDGGTTEAGLPWFAMELVDGVPIDTYCDDHQLSVETRLELVEQLCEAVDLAHRHLVVHRDIKPSNVLVTTDGTPKLVDFGIAKLLDPDHGNNTHWTAVGLRPLTPAFASPEHLRGEAVSMASDVYSIGVLLYTLTTGKLPYHTPTRPDALLRAIEAGPPSRPSRRAGSESDRGHLHKQISPDLDAIVLKALEADATARYPTVRALADDLRRHRQHLPVVARRPSVAYRLARFVRRHRLGVAAAVVMLALAGNAIVQSVRHTRQLRVERNQALEAQSLAERKESEARATIDFLIDIFEQSRPNKAQGEELTALEILSRGSQQLNSELHDQPLVRARLLDTIGRAYNALGVEDQAEPMLLEALELRRQHLGDDDPETAQSLTSLAAFERTRGRPTQAVELFRQALKIQRTALGEDHVTVAATRRDLAASLRYVGELEEADRLSEQALRALETALGANARATLIATTIRAQVLTALTRWSEAEQLYLDLVDRQLDVLGTSHPDVAATMNNLAYLYVQSGQPEEGEPWYRRALEISVPVLGEDHPHVALTRQNLVSALAQQGRLAESETVLRQLLESRKRVLGPYNPQVGSTLVRGIGNILLAQHRWADAEPPLREGLELFERTLGPDHQWTAFAHGYLAASLYGQHRDSEAEHHLREAMVLIDAAENLHPSAPFALHQIADHLEAAGAPMRAEGVREIAERARSINQDE